MLLVVLVCFVCACVFSIRFLPVNLNGGIEKINMPVIPFLKIIDSVFRLIIVVFQEDHNST